MMNCAKFEQINVNENDSQQLFFNYFTNPFKINDLQRQKVLDRCSRTFI